MKQVLLILIFCPFIIYGQGYDCESIFNWTKKTFEENDAGFQYIIDTKGEEVYAVHNQTFLDKVKKVENPANCQQVVNEWLLFFRKGHISLDYLGQSSENPGSATPEKSKEKFKDWETFSIPVKDFEQYLDKKADHDYEGIWKTGAYKIGIKKEDSTYVGFIIESENELWKKNQVKLKIFKQVDKINSVYYMGDHSAVESENVSLLSINNLQIGDIYFTRIYPEVKEDKSMSAYQLHFKALDAALPFIEQFNETTLYFRIPSFTGTPEKEAIDSLIATNKTKILSTENLIIDIRNGTGGMDKSYTEIIPLIYTNPIRTPGAELLSTPLNNQRMLDMINKTGIFLKYYVKFSEEEKNDFKRKYDILSNRLGEFVNLDSTSVYVTTYDTIYPFPKNVGIIHNQNNGSTDEQFLLAARQSKKVKLFGRTTMGALDFSNMNITTSPNGDFELWYTLSKSSRIPFMAIDDKGVQPDYYIDEEIPEHKWIDFVSEILNE